MTPDVAAAGRATNPPVGKGTRGFVLAGQTWPTYGQVWANFDQHWPTLDKLGQLWAKSDWLSLGRIRQSFVDSGTKFGADSTQFGHGVSRIRRCCPDFGRRRPSLGQIDQTLAKFEQDWSSWAEGWPDVAQSWPSLAEFAQRRPILVECFHVLAKFGQHRAISGEHCQLADTFGQHGPKFGPNLQTCQVRRNPGRSLTPGAAVLKLLARLSSQNALPRSTRRSSWDGRRLPVVGAPPRDAHGTAGSAPRSCGLSSPAMTAELRDVPGWEIAARPPEARVWACMAENSALFAKSCATGCCMAAPISS